MNQQQTKKDNKKRGERGSILATAALSMVSLLLAAGLAIDVSHFYTAKAELQNAADAAALGAASQLNSTSGGIKMAVNQATTALNKYDFSKTLNITRPNVTFGKNLNDATYDDEATAASSPSQYRFVKVTLEPQAVNNTFSALVLGNTQNISATATAGLSVGLTMNKFYTAFIFVEEPTNLLTKGMSYVLDPKAANSASPMSYRILTGSEGCGGTNAYNSPLVAAGQLHDYGCIGDAYTIPNLPATSPGPAFTADSMCRFTQIGVNTRFATSPGEYAAIHPGANAIDTPPDTVVAENITYDEYTTRQALPPEQANGVMNRRVITLPIALNTNYNVTTRKATGNRLAAFFIKKKVGTNPAIPADYCKLHVEYIGKPVAVPVGTYTPGGTQMTELSIPVLYK